MDPEYYMNIAIELAQLAASEGETPVGAVVVSPDGKIIGQGYNKTEHIDATCHAEIEAIRHASAAIGDWRLEGCSLFVTMEPCPMCAGAIMNSRISKLYYGVKDKYAGSCGSVINLFMEGYRRRVQIYGGISEDRCKKLLSDFFSSLRHR